MCFILDAYNAVSDIQSHELCDINSPHKRPILWTGLLQASKHNSNNNTIHATHSPSGSHLLSPIENDAAVFHQMMRFYREHRTEQTALPFTGSLP